MLFNKNENKPASSIEEKIKLYRRQGHIVPPRKIIKNAEQIEGIRESAKINTAVLDHVALTSGKECQPRILTRWYTISPWHTGLSPHR